MTLKKKLIEFSIITIVKNNFQDIKKTINSVKYQEFKNYEHIIIDGNSTDGTSDIIKKNLNSKIRYHRSKDRGIYEAINKGIKLSKGKFIGLLHSGDYYFGKNILKIVSKNIKKKDILFGNVFYFNKKLKISRSWIKPIYEFNKNNSFKIAHTAMFIKKSTFLKIGYYNNIYKISADTEFILRSSLCNLKYCYLNKILIFMKSGGVSYSVKNFFKKSYEDLKIYKNFFGYLYIYMYSKKLFSKLFDIILINKTKLKKFNNILLKENKKIS